MDIELCKRCVDYDNSKIVTNTTCEVCHRIDDIGNGSNNYFLELNEIEPECCGKCEFKFQTPAWMSGDYYCKAARYFDTDDRHITNPNIRKNYLNKNKPKFCPYKRRNSDARK